ncbi:zinc metallopeptidase [Adhaeribacter radiodurans]|uniref:Zinc metallopeptidase n=1 Tax=Adhaeribacter radiodurans TaxID=2745197 RepID=A0A7L7LE12_9BACT|nr:zinc metallopeptidase [Adhaeribacter radiodurans]QMU31013.1 zinc metallopeptidase [Adhaeribacter radiodurans]
MGGVYLIAILVMLVSLFVSWRLKSKFAQYSQIGLHSGLSGREIAEMMLADHNIRDVRVISTEGQLTDHYNPADKTVNLSEGVYASRSAAAAAVAAHECGHAVQHATAYSMLKFRSAMVPALSVASRYMQWIILIGIFMINTSIIPLTIGVALFALTTLFSFVTLPVEFDASRRALAWMDRRGVVTTQEHAMAKDSLKWAALTYVVAAIGSLATLLYYVSLLMGRRD